MNYQIFDFHPPKKSVTISAVPPSQEWGMLYTLRNIGYHNSGPQYYVRRQGMDSMLMIYTISGRGYLEYRGKKYDILPGQYMVIDCNEYQDYGSAGDTWEFYWFHFKGAESRSIVHNILRTCGPVCAGDDHRAIFDDLFIRADYPCLKSSLLISEMIYRLLIHLVLEAGKNKMVSEGVELALSFIETHLTEAISLQEIAAAAHLSKFHLSREFMQQMNQSPYAYLMSMRLNHAKKLLLSTDDPIAEIAEACGFSNLSCFFRQFKKVQGCTPLQYRKNARFNTEVTPNTRV